MYLSRPLAKAQVDLGSELIKAVSEFNGIPQENVKEINAKDVKSRDGEIHGLLDGDYYYEVDDNGNIISLAKKRTDNVIIKHKDTLEESKLKAIAYLEKLTKAVPSYDLSYKETNLSGNQAISFYFKGKDGSSNTGSYAYIDLALDGTLLGAVIKTENPGLYKEATSINVESAKSIILNYINSHKKLSEFSDKITDNYLKFEKDVFNGANIWRVTMTIPNSPYEKILFTYIIDAKTGEITFKGEPALPGF